MLKFETHWPKQKDLEEKWKNNLRVPPLCKVDFPTMALLYQWKPQLMSKWTDQDTAKPKIPTSGPSGEWGLMQMANPSLLYLESIQTDAFILPYFRCRLSCKCGHSHIFSPESDSWPRECWPFPAKEQPLGSLTCYYFMLNRPDLCNIFYQATVLSLNSLFWMNTDFVTRSLLYNEMQTMKRLNQFTKNLFVKQRGDVPNLVWAVHAALDKGVKM